MISSVILNGSGYSRLQILFLDLELCSLEPNFEGKKEKKELRLRLKNKAEKEQELRTKKLVFFPSLVENFFVPIQDETMLFTFYSVVKRGTLCLGERCGWR